MDAKEVVRRYTEFVTSAAEITAVTIKKFTDSIEAEIDAEDAKSAGVSTGLAEEDPPAEEKKHPDEYTPDDNPRLWRATMEACTCGGKPPDDRAMCPACRVWHVWCGREVVAAEAKKTCGNCNERACNVRNFMFDNPGGFCKGGCASVSPFYCNHHTKGGSEQCQ